MLRIGPAGNSDSFYQSGLKHTYQAAKWLSEMGLNAFEYSFGRGIKMTDATAAKINEEFSKHDVQVSAHAPYYVNFATADPENLQKSIAYVRKSIELVKKMGGKRVVFHPASLSGNSRQDALSLTLKNVGILVEELYKSGLSDFLICAETMGKHGQLGTVDEVIQICKIDPCIYPCYDFGHINSYMLGGLKTKDDFRRVLDTTFAGLGQLKTANMHIHFSKIMYGKCGEIKHLTFEDTQYGPEYLPLAQLIDEYKMTPVVICESNGTMAEDALIIKKCHK